VVRLSTRIAIYTGSFLGLTAAYTWLYRWGMLTLESEPRTLIHSLEVVVQSMTTTGYGQDAPWESMEMTIFMMVIQLTGIAYIFVAIPLFVVPWVRGIIAASPPESVDRLSEHVVIIGYTALCETLVDELSARGTPYLVVEADEDQARTLHERGLNVLHADPTSEAVIDAASIEAAAAVVVGSAEGEYIRAVLGITDAESDAMVVGLIEAADRARYLRYAGVDEVLFPTHRLGKVLGDKVREIIISEIESAAADAIEIREYALPAKSDLLGEPLADSRRLESTNATLLGAWTRGDLFSTPSADVYTDRTTRLLVAGLATDHEAVAETVGIAGRPYQPAAKVIIVGAGLVGEIVTGVLERAGIETTVVDREDGPLVDVVGDATNEPVLKEATIEAADSLIVTLAEPDAIDTTLVARARNTDLEIIAAAAEESQVDGLRLAGADYVLALPSVAGRMLSQTVFERAVMPLNDRIRLIAVSADRLADPSVQPAKLREEIGCAIVAREREGEIQTVSEVASIDPDEQLIVAGTDRALDRLAEQYLDE